MRGQVDPRRLKASLVVLALVVTTCGCSASTSATPTADHHSTASTGAPQTTTTTSTPSATPTTVPAPVSQAPGWSLALTTLPPGGGFTSLSCISDTFCVAAGGGTTGDGAALVSGSGVTVSWDGAAWSSPSVYFPAPATGPVTAPVLPTITCTSGPLCVIVDGSDHVSTGDGTNWSNPVPIAAPAPLPANPADPGVGHPGSRTSSVSCPTPSLCAVVDNTGRVFTLRGRR